MSRTSLTGLLIYTEGSEVDVCSIKVLPRHTEGRRRFRVPVTRMEATLENLQAEFDVARMTVDDEAYLTGEAERIGAAAVKELLREALGNSGAHLGLATELPRADVIGILAAASST